MAKPTKRDRGADIAQVGALIFRRPEPASTGDAPAGNEAGEGAGRVPGGQLAQHPATAERADRRTRRDVFDLDPRRVVERGPYIREWDEGGEEFERLVAAVAARGEIDTPIWVRSQGPTGRREFILVAGKGRLRAALRNGLATVPVRDLGELDNREAVARQAEENLNREDMTPAETAQALSLLHGFGESISAIGRRLHRDKGYVSYMVRVGEAVGALTGDEQARLARRGVLQVRQCQTIGAMGDVAARVAALREVLGGVAAGAPGVSSGASAGGAADAAGGAADAGGDSSDGPGRRAPGRADEHAPFYGRAIRGGRTFRMRWVERDLRTDPAAVAKGFVDAVRAEGEQLLEALGRLEAEGGGGRAGRDALARARRALEQLAGS